MRELGTDGEVVWRMQGGWGAGARRGGRGAGGSNAPGGVEEP